MEQSEADSDEENNGSEVKMEEINEFDEDEDPFKEVSISFSYHRNSLYLLNTYLIYYLV
jgi:hypothetical protein